MDIRTNHKPRALLTRDDVPDQVLESQFDWLDPETYDGFIHYLNTWYHLSEFMRVQPEGNLALLGFDGYAGDSYFSATLIKIVDQGESVILARAYS